MLAREEQDESIGSNFEALDDVSSEIAMGSFNNASAVRESPIRRRAVVVKAEVDDLVVYWCKHARLDSTKLSWTPMEFKDLYRYDVNCTLFDVVASNVAE